MTTTVSSMPAGSQLDAEVVAGDGIRTCRDTVSQPGQDTIRRAGPGATSSMEAAVGIGGDPPHAAVSAAHVDDRVGDRRRR